MNDSYASSTLPVMEAGLIDHVWTLREMLSKMGQ